jgi:glucose-6-phosphate 1-dehydrogenase
MDDITFIILGATGNLTKKKLIPAIYHLIESKKVKKFAIVGVARNKNKAETILNKSKKYIKNVKSKVWKELEKNFHYLPLDFYQEEKFCSLDPFVKEIERKNKLSGNRLFYLATLPQHFPVIAKTLKKCALTKEKKIKKGKNNWVRTVFEKPFGHDLKSAKKINKTIKKIFKEKQIYRIDHYLGKELIQNIAITKFTNTFLEPLLNNKYVDHVQVVLSEDVGIEERGPFYDQYGVIRDVIQNHMMQMLSLSTMEAPKKLSGEHIRDEKVKILKAIKTTKELVVGQYVGYKKEKGIPKNSKTETFAATKLFVNNKRWKKVPFYLITGKKMKKKITSVYFQFKQARCLNINNHCDFKSNYLTIQIQPEEGYYMRMNAKVPGEEKVTAVKMDFCHACTFGPNTPKAYETLLFDVIEGDQSSFVRTDEIEQQWKITDKIIKQKKKLYSYKKKTYPKQANKLIEKDKRSWHLVVK